ncbi:Uncharacterized conserved protein YabE, contains G5 and tandem DUF348 domains [Amphibacillus marinus]|uniref:Uncharacterized conserved protein YabE, contains G5 and tandem DUF348 domains n=1 Tax=Amphibacillus marinus TaxID=872970 RepID=A0A1H8TNY0_9BACI|nr:ubiquitin-like domain-containing protein [Amphibacillus marinus]SEO92565.1 Uncharacterized conserved protein YabE, contains G5 and tandem DUF348 domains [Amphibacillus marinus]
MNPISKLLPVLKSKRIIALTSMVALIFSIGFIILETTKAELQFTHNGETETLITRANTVEGLLEELEIDVSEHDNLSHSMNAEIESDMHVVYKEAKEVTVAVDGEVASYYTTQDTVEQFLSDIELEVADHDVLNVDLTEKIVEQLAIELDRAVQVMVLDANEEDELWTTEGTVADLLEAQAIELNELDRVEPELDTLITKELIVSITRVEEVTDIIEEVVDYSTVRRNDSSIEQGQEEVITDGVDGLIEKQYRVTIENGEEVKRELISEQVKQESEQRVVAVGTKVIQQTVSRSSSASASSSSNTSSSSRTLSMEATAYNWDCGSCDGRGLTATGYDLKANPNGVVAVDPSVIPLGTRLYIEGYGYAVARDTGGAVTGNKIDLHMSSIGEARNFGRKTVTVEILD